MLVWGFTDAFGQIGIRSHSMFGYRNDLIVHYVAGKRVLDIGSVGQTGEYCLWNVLNDSAAMPTTLELTVGSRGNLARHGFDVFVY